MAKSSLLYLLLFIVLPLTSVFSQTDAERLLQSRMRTPMLQQDSALTGEGLCWHAAYDMNRFVDQYRKTSDAAFLDAAVTYYNALIQKLYTSPDGYKGWVGSFIYDNKYICDVHVGDAILINPMLEFAEIIMKGNNASLSEKYREDAQRYIQLAKKHLLEKWDARKTWREDGPYGAYVSWDQYMTPGNLDAWRTLPVGKSTLTLPFNKQNTMALAALRIYRITGEEKYRTKALKIFNYMKSRMCLFSDHYVWNYWEPFGAWDIDDSSRNKLNHWVNVHPYRNYQSGELHQIAEAYHSGITFSRIDIERIINTNLKVMWNGDTENPKWRNSNYAVEVDALGHPSITEAPGGSFTELAGELWTALADFSEPVRQLGGIYMSEPVSFDRHYDSLQVAELNVPYHSDSSLIMAAAMPSLIAQGKETNLISQTRIKGNVTIELYDQAGEKRLALIRKGNPQKSVGASILIHPWIAEAATGDYRIRWTVNNNFREFPIKIVESSSEVKQVGLY